VIPVMDAGRCFGRAQKKDRAGFALGNEASAV
jgi:hypothetical protein